MSLQIKSIYYSSLLQSLYYIAMAVILFFLIIGSIFLFKELKKLDKRERNAFIKTQINFYNIGLGIIWSLATIVFIYLFLSYLNYQQPITISVIAVLLAAFMASFSNMKTLQYTSNSAKIKQNSEYFKMIKVLYMTIHECNIHLSSFININEKKMSIERNHLLYQTIFSSFSTKFLNKDFLATLDLKLMISLFDIGVRLNLLADYLHDYDRFHSVNNLNLNKKFYLNSRNFNDIKILKHEILDEARDLLNKITEFDDKISAELKVQNMVLRITKNNL